MFRSKGLPKPITSPTDKFRRTKRHLSDDLTRLRLNFSRRRLLHALPRLVLAIAFLVVSFLVFLRYARVWTRPVLGSCYLTEMASSQQAIRRRLDALHYRRSRHSLRQAQVFEPAYICTGANLGICKSLPFFECKSLTQEANRKSLLVIIPSLITRQKTSPKLSRRCTFTTQR
jgi:hypothetical protein